MSAADETPVDTADGTADGLLTAAMVPTRASNLRANLAAVEELRGLPPAEWPSADAMVEALGWTIIALEELERPDLARLAYREQLAACRELAAAQPGQYAGALASAPTGLRDTLVELRRYEEAL